MDLSTEEEENTSEENENEENETMYDDEEDTSWGGRGREESETHTSQQSTCQKARKTHAVVSKSVQKTGQSQEGFVQLSLFQG